MGLSVTVLGCSGSFAAPGGACTGYLVRSDETTVWLDCGPGTLAMLQEHVALTDVDAIVITHGHPDHWLELPVVRNALRYFYFVEGVPVYGTAHNRELAEAVIWDGVSPTFVWTDIDETSDLIIGDQRWRFERTDHPVPTFAPRVDSGGRSFFFSADTGPDFTPSDAHIDVDLALVEASMRNEEEPLAVPHLSGRQAGTMAKPARRLVITHLPPGAPAETHRAEAAEAFGHEVEVAEVGRTFDV